MPVSIELNTPLADALNEVVQPKLVEVGWSTGGGDDSALAEYVILMLVNGKTQEQIAAELSNDLLSLGPDDTEAVDFSRWLFEQVEILNQKLNGGPAQTEQQGAPQSIPSYSEQQHEVVPTGGANGEDAEMGDDAQNGQDGSIPTGPKQARNPRQSGRGRLMGQISKAMDRSNDSVLHRVRNQQGSERINTHPPKGPRNMHNRNGRMMGRAGPGMGMGMGMNNGPMQNMSPGANMMPMNPQQQMQMMAMLEEQARMMAQLMPGVVPPAINPAFQNGPQRNQQGRSLFERTQHQPQGSNFQQRGHQNGNGFRPPQQDISMSAQQDTTGGSMEVDGTKQNETGEPDPNTVCKFNLKCTRKDCPFAHQSPAAPEGTLVDVNDNCSFGAACKNRKCVARHPSPAQKAAHQSEELCRFFPHCANPNCAFKHPSMPMCRNGADCTVQGCKFTHLQIPCKFTPCLNRMCPYKHVEGQRGVFGDKVWKASDAEKGQGTHVSERKFVSDENGEEELIKPGAGASEQEGGGGQEIAT